MTYAKAITFIHGEFNEHVNALDFVWGEFNNLIQSYSEEDQRKFHMVQLLIMNIISNNIVFVDKEAA